MKFLLVHNIEIVMQCEWIKFFFLGGGGDSARAEIFLGKTSIRKFLVT